MLTGHATAQDNVIDRYSAMSKALNQTGRPVLFSVVGWGVGDPWKGWGQTVSPYFSSFPIAVSLKKRAESLTRSRLSVDCKAQQRARIDSELLIYIRNWQATILYRP